MLAMPLAWGDHLLGMLLITGPAGKMSNDECRMTNQARPPDSTFDNRQSAFPCGPSRDDQLMIRFAADTASVAVGGLQDRLALEHHYVATMSSLMEAVEAKDRYTAGHTSRVMQYSLELAAALGIEGKPLKDIEFAAALHDIGKIAVSDQIINKPGKLTDAEFEEMKRHPATGDRMLRHLRFLRTSRMILRAHHERYDGKGYLDRLTGEEIPLGGRILALADAFDAMTSDRSYRQAMSEEQALREIEAKAGTQFDPRLASVFTRLVRQKRDRGAEAAQAESQESRG
jgi:HD-GYP domain-containing protein (c-di-GMP phosphodiesterase class II)